MVYRPDRRPVDAELAAQIESLMVRFPGYGYRRVAAALGLGIKPARTAMRRLGWVKRRRKPRTTHPGKLQGGANLLNRFALQRPGQVLVADVTCFRLHRPRWAYLAVVLDAFTRQLLGWAVSHRNDTHLTKAALVKVLSDPSMAPSWIHHSDRGSNYVSSGYVRLVESCGGTCSYSDPGCPTQNAKAESFMKTFKLEEAGREVYESLEDARASFTRYFDLYNQERLHSSIGMKAPDQFKEEFLLQT
jgi:transposase InsO family protein